MIELVKLGILWRNKKAAAFGVKSYFESRWLFAYVKILIVIGMFLQINVFAALCLSYLLLEKEISKLVLYTETWAFNQMLMDQAKIRKEKDAS